MVSLFDRILGRNKVLKKNRFDSSWNEQEGNGERLIHSGGISIVTDIGSTTTGTEQTYLMGIKNNQEPKKKLGRPKKQYKPIEVMEHLLAKEQIKFDVTDINKKIAAIEFRIDFIKHELGNDTREEEQVLSWLKARKELKNHGKKFKWAVTNKEKIEWFCKKYNLRQSGWATYHRNVPNEALVELKKYLDLYSKVSDADPKLVIIGDHDETKKDPILIASSPFGNYFYIIGAWDKEVEIMEELYKELD